MPKLKPRSIADLSKSMIWETSPMLQLSNARSESERGFGNSDRKRDKQVRIKRRFKEAKKNVNERSGRRIAKETDARKTLYRFQGSLNRTLTTAQRKKDSGKTSLGKRDFTKQLVSGSESTKIKLQRAQGGCPGTIRRRRTWQAAKSYGEPQAGIDP